MTAITARNLLLKHRPDSSIEVKEGTMQKDFAADGGEQKIANYVNAVFKPEDAILAEIRKRAEATGIPPIHVGQMDGLHLEVLVRASGARKAVEIGTLAGYSAVCIARGMGAEGKLHTFEFEPKHADVARESLKRAGVERQVEIHVGAAVAELPKINHLGPFDLVFVDADKVSYPQYLAWAAEHLRVGGLLIGDNTFAWGMIADEKFDNSEDEANARALQAFNRAAAQGGRFRATILPTGEGLTLAVKIR
jgi:caffeoyl-CoA O-methyltransferase